MQNHSFVRVPRKWRAQAGLGNEMQCGKASGMGASESMPTPQSHFLERVGKPSAATASWVCDPRRFTSCHAQNGPVLGLMLCFHCLAVLNNFWTGGCAFVCCTGPTSYVVSPDYWDPAWSPWWYSAMLLSNVLCVCFPHCLFFLPLLSHLCSSLYIMVHT